MFYLILLHCIVLMKINYSDSIWSLTLNCFFRQSYFCCHHRSLNIFKCIYRPNWCRLLGEMQMTRWLLGLSHNYITMRKCPCIMLEAHWKSAVALSMYRRNCWLQCDCVGQCPIGYHHIANMGLQYDGTYRQCCIDSCMTAFAIW